MRFRQAFSIYPRQTGRRVVWYYRTYRPDGSRTPGKSTGLTAKTAARAYCEDLYRAGRLVPTKDVTFADYAAEWWLWGKCQYLRERLERSAPDRPRVSQAYAARQRTMLVNHLLPEFGKLSLCGITPRHIDRWLLRLRDDGLMESSANLAYSTLHIMLREARRRGLIDVDPGENVRRLGEKRSDRGILTLQEARRLFAEGAVKEVWNDSRMHRTISMLAASTGLRLGEIQALRAPAIYPDHVHVEASWSSAFGVGPTKSRAVRDVPLPGKVYAAMTPMLGYPGFIFSASGGDAPIHADAVRDRFYDALARIGIPREQIKARNIVFHSWRRFANTLMRAHGIPDPVVREVTGHASAEMTEHYTAFQLEHFAGVVEVQEELFG